MKKNFHFLRNLMLTSALLLISNAYAGIPVWKFSPLTATNISVTSNSTATVQYSVVNQSSRSHTLKMKAIPGIQSNGCKANGHQSCILTLTITGSLLKGSVNSGPVLCDKGNPNECYQPGSPNQLSIQLIQAGLSAYATNFNTNTVSVINSTTNQVIDSILVGNAPYGIAITPDKSKVYVDNSSDGTVSVINTLTNTVIGAPIAIGSSPTGMTATPDGTRVYVADLFNNTVSVIATATNTVVGAPIPIGSGPYGMAITLDGTKIYVANSNDNTVSIISTLSNTVIGTVSVGSFPFAVTITPDGKKVYVGNYNDNTVSIINTQTDTVVDTISGPSLNGPSGIAI